MAFLIHVELFKKYAPIFKFSPSSLRERSGLARPGASRLFAHAAHQPSENFSSAVILSLNLVL